MLGPSYVADKIQGTPAGVVSYSLMKNTYVIYNSIFFIFIFFFFFSFRKV